LQDARDCNIPDTSSRNLYKNLVQEICARFSHQILTEVYGSFNLYTFAQNKAKILAQESMSNDTAYLPQEEAQLWL